MNANEREFGFQPSRSAFKCEEDAGLLDAPVLISVLRLVLRTQPRSAICVHWRPFAVYPPEWIRFSTVALRLNPSRRMESLDQLSCEERLKPSTAVSRFFKAGG